MLSALIAVILLSIRAGSLWRTSSFWVLVFGGLLFLTIGAHYALYLSNGTLYVRDGKLGATDFLGRTREIAIEEASAVLLCSVTYTGGANVRPYLFAVPRTTPVP